MKTCKARTLDLLKEIKSVCEAEGIKYYISGELALCCMDNKDVKDEFNNGTVLVFAEDVRHLSTILSKNKQRKIESPANNNKFPGFYLRYMDTSTSLLNLYETVYTYETNSVGVNIEIICGRRKRSIKGKVLSYLKKIWVAEYLPHYLKSAGHKKGSTQYFTHVLCKMMQCGFVMNKIFNAWLIQGSVKSKNVEIATSRGEIIKCKSGIFDEGEKVVIAGEPFEIVCDLYNFTNEYFKSGRRLRSTIYDICDFETPWKVFEEAIVKNNIPLKKYQKEQQKYLFWRRTVYNPVRRQRLRYFNYMFCAEDRMLTYKEFKGEKKAKVMELYAQRDFESLEQHMQGYIEKIRKYSRYQIGFCSDPELMEVALCTMIHEIYMNTSVLPDFKKKSNSIIRIVRNTDYRHFDSIENVFWGEREDKVVLSEIKKRVHASVKSEAQSYYSKFKK